MPKDMGAFEPHQLRRQIDHAYYRPSVDETSWEQFGLVCVARTAHMNIERFSNAFMGELAGMFPEVSEDADSHFGPQVCRDWVVARGTDLANLWYRGPEGAAVARDLTDCEGMVRSIRFEP